jgi:predicted porin
MNGFTFTTDGEINQFYVHTDNHSTGNINEVRDGLLPGFLGFNVTAPEVNGLKIGARVSISPATNGFSYAGSMEQREAFFTVDGSFGQVLMGKALGLYGSHNILTDQTLYGVGWGTGGNGQTTLGGIGLGYDYADWRSQIKWTSPDMNGFKIALAIADPTGSPLVTGAGATGPIGSSVDSNSLRYEGDLSYAGAFDGGNFSLWLSGMNQNQSVEDKRAWTVGGTVKASGFEGMAQYSDSRDASAATAGSYAISGTTTPVITYTAGTASTKLDLQQYILQAGYRFGGTTLASLSYGHLQDNVSDKSRRYTFGVYHDVSKNLKLVAEFSRVYNDNSASTLDQNIYSLGGFVSW